MKLSDKILMLRKKEGMSQEQLADKPMEYEILVEWLRKAKQYNGFYIYGI